MNQQALGNLDVTQVFGKKRQATQGLELSVAGQNLLHAHHLEYGFPSPTTVQIQRSVYGKIAWRY